MHYDFTFLMFDFAQGHLCFHVLVFLFVSGDEGGAQTFELWEVFFLLTEVNLCVNVSLSVCWIYRVNFIIHTSLCHSNAALVL